MEPNTVAVPRNLVDDIFQILHTIDQDLRRQSDELAESDPVVSWGLKLFQEAVRDVDRRLEDCL